MRVEGKPSDAMLSQKEPGHRMRACKLRKSLAADTICCGCSVMARDFHKIIRNMYHFPVPQATETALKPQDTVNREEKAFARAGMFAFRENGGALDKRALPDCTVAKNVLDQKGKQ
ncbi:MAG: hypothetical protein AB1921_06650 [Thermodesulfobacteriota bacterium]